MAVDFKELNDKLLSQVPDLLYKWLPDGKVEGKYFSARNPVRGDNNPGSFKIDLSNGIWKDYASEDSGGDLVSLYAYINNKKQLEAAKELGAIMPDIKAKPKLVEVKEDLLFPVTKDINFAVPYHSKYGEHSEGPWIYRDYNGNIFGGVVRYKTPTGKEVLPIVYSKTKNDWVFKGFPDPRPLYKLDKLKDARQIIIVEGEKCVEEGGRMLPMARLTTWQGGAQAVKKANWQPLYGEIPVLIWRDNDEAGEKAEKEIAKLLHGNVKRLMVLNPNALKNKPPGWDIADAINEGWSKEQIAEFLKANTVEYTNMPRGGAQQPDLPSAAGINTAPLNKYFKELGMTGNNKYGFYNYTSGMIHEADIKLVYDKKFITSLTGGDPYYWTVQTPKDKDGETKVNWASFGSQLVTKCQNLGVFNQAKVRGLGMWEDKGNYIVNAGRDFYVNGEKVHLYDYESRFIYAARDAVKIDIDKALDINYMREIRDMTKHIRWIDPETAILFFGWMIGSTLGELLPWRSHIYLQGGSGSGKSWICSFMRVFFGQFNYGTTIGTTEAGIRRGNKNGSTPIICDETEPDEAPGFAGKIQAILKLARLSSRNDGMSVSMAKSGGGDEQFTMQNCFCFASIIPSVMQYQDETRITILALKEQRQESEEEADNFITLEKWRDNLPEDISPKYLGWCTKNSQKILDNIAVFNKAARVHLKNKRFAEQIGMMLGGYYSVEYDEVISDEMAVGILNQYDWWRLLPNEETTAENKVIDSFNSAMVTIQVQDKGLSSRVYTIERSIRSLVANYIYSKHYDDFPGDVDMFSALIQPGDLTLIDAETIEHTLSNLGVKYEAVHKAVAIAISSEPLSNLLRGSSAQANKWASTLRNIKGVFSYPLAVYFKIGRKRAIGVPVRAFLGT